MGGISLSFYDDQIGSATRNWVIFKGRNPFLIGMKPPVLSQNRVNRVLTQRSETRIINPK